MPITMKKHNIILQNLKLFTFLLLGVLAFIGCEKDEATSEEQVRMFRPVLNEDLFAEGNHIIVNMGKLKSAISYYIEVSRDSFATVDYQISSDTNYVRINNDLIGEDLFWNALYQVRGKAVHADANFDSKLSDFGSVRTEKFPSILYSPVSYDMIDVAARMRWQLLGAAVTHVKVYAADDLKLKTPLAVVEVPTADQAAGQTIVGGLNPLTTYQLAIFSGETLRGWENYTTIAADIDPTAANVVDLRESTSTSDLQTAMASAAEGAILLVSHGSEHIIDAPSPVSSSFTVRAALGFGPQKAKVVMPANLDLASGATVDHIRFVNLELRGTDWGAKYVMNVSQPGTINEVRFDNCFITNHRGVFRIKTNGVTLDKYIINESIVDSIGSYAVVTQDKNGSVLNHIEFTKSTFNHLQYYFIVSRNNSETINIEDCTIANATDGRELFRYREAGLDQVTGGINISNTILGRRWDYKNEELYGVKGIQGLDQTVFNVSNCFSTTDLVWDGDNSIPNFPLGNAGATQEELWVDPDSGDFNFEDKGFIGKSSAGDPRWRVQL